MFCYLSKIEKEESKQDGGEQEIEEIAEHKPER